MKSVSEKVEKETFFTKEYSKYLYGIAILLMVWHHLFLSPDILGNGVISLLPVNVRTASGWFCKICVAIYAFITGYGMMQIFLNTGSRMSLYAKKAVKQLLLFYKRYWIVFFAITPALMAIGRKRMDLSEFILNVIGLETTVVGTWWYVKNYVCYIVLIPVIGWTIWGGTQNIWADVGKCGLTYTIFYGLNKYLVSGISGGIFDSIYGTYFVVVIEGMLISKWRLFEKAHHLLRRLNISVQLAIVSMGLICIISLRTILAESETWNTGDMIFAPSFIFVIIWLIRYLSGKGKAIYVVANALKILGRYSFYVWMIHPILRYSPFLEVIKIPRIAVLIYCWTLLISLSGAVFFDFIMQRVSVILLKLKKSQM